MFEIKFHCWFNDVFANPIVCTLANAGNVCWLVMIHSTTRISIGLYLGLYHMHSTCKLNNIICTVNNTVVTLMLVGFYIRSAPSGISQTTFCAK